MTSSPKKGQPHKAQNEPKKIIVSQPRRTPGAKAYGGAAALCMSYPTQYFSSQDAYDQAIKAALATIKRGEAPKKEPQLD